MDGVIFDIDGTLLDTMGVWHDAGARYLKTLGIQAEPGLGDLLFEETVESGAVYMIEHYGLDKTVEQVADGIDAEMNQFYFTEAEFKPGARELLEKVKALGIPMTIATSTHRECYEGALKRLGVMDYFPVTFNCTEVGATKSEPKIFYDAAEYLGTEPEHTWVIEDGLYSVRTAKAAGFRTVGVYDSTSEKDQEELKELSDRYYLDLTQFDLL